MRLATMMMLPALALSGLALQGCATATEGAQREVTVMTDDGVPAQCVLSNSSGRSVVPSTPGSAIVTDAWKTLSVTCASPGRIGTAVSEGNPARTASQAEAGASSTHQDSVVVHMQRR